MAEVITPDPKFEEMRKRYYHAENVQFQLIESLKYREGVFIRLATERLKSMTIRDMKINAVCYWNLNAERYNLHQYQYNVYASLARFPNLPMFSFNNIEKRTQMDEFNKHYPSYITGYDLLFDIDNTDLRIAYATTAKVKEVFEYYDVPYVCGFSGNKGFHIRVAYDDFPKELKELSWQQLSDHLKLFAENFRTIHALYSLDLSIFDLRRISKLFYSIVYPFYFIALPLSDEEFNHFTLEYVSLPHWLRPENMRKLYKRGLLKRKGTPEGFGKLVKKYTTL